MTTKYKIAEEVQRLLKGNPVIAGRVHINDIKLLIEQVANQLLKTEYFSMTMPDGETIPNNCMIYTYDGIPVTTYKTTKSKCTLPSIPISLPKNMGVLHVSTTTDIDSPFIPIPSSMYGIVKPLDLIGELSGLIGYEVMGSDIIFTKNLPGININSVLIRLVGVDISKVSDYEILPLSSDMEAQIVQQVYSIFVAVPPADRAKTTSD
jgi:hypothetical protein